MDDDLAHIRAKRLEQLRAQQGAPDAGASPAAGAPGGGTGGADDAAKRAQMEEMRRGMLVQILSNEARERLSRVSIVKPEKARAVEDYLLKLAQSRQLSGKVAEGQLIELLEQISNQGKTENKIVYNRRRSDSDDDDDDDDLDL
ncbi:PDCD5-related protein [Cladochytrium replicatum]|nr:PDCD5-related protein [Cladochytrium replicatum]